ncbi:MAG: oxygenase MpaB family protein [Agitococcus sp.]|nr:oxygenase MpaB family protein [Agitococcus sp.]
MRDLFWARKELATLDPVRDARRYAQITFETRFGQPMFIHALFSAAFAFNMGDPKIAAVLYRDGSGTIIKHTRQRNFETLVFFGLIYKHGDDAEGQKIIAKMSNIHKHFNISNDLFLYTLSTLACLPRRISDRFAGEHGLTKDELESQFQLWRRVGELMGIKEIPASQDAFLAWMIDYERRHFSPTPAATMVIAALAQEWAEYWYPKPLQAWGEGLFYALIDPELRTQLNLREPSEAQTLAAKVAVRSIIRGVRLLPDPAERSLVEHFGKELKTH